MTTTNQKLTLANVLEIIEDKLDEAKDFLDEMEKTSADRKRFRHRLSAFLSAAGSVTMFMKEHGTEYAQKINNTTFVPWYNGKQSLFVTPTARNKHAIGTDKTWVYLAVARNKTIHVEQVNPANLARGDIHTRFNLQAEPGTGQISPPVSVPAPNQNKLWAFKPLTLEVQGKQYIFNPPVEDVVTVCKNHIKTLEDLIAECEVVLQ